MLKNSNIYLLLEVFFDDPIPEGVGFQLRELSRKIALAPKSVKLYLDELEKEQLILSKSHRIHGYPVYYANRDSGYFRFLKRLNILKRIKETGLLDYLVENCMPDVIILFGSSSRGEDTRDSDIDLYVQSAEKRMNLYMYEEALNRRINLLFSEDFNKLSDELKSNIINGDRLKGYLKVQMIDG